MVLKKVATILFIIVHLLSTTELYQFLKLPLVFQHFAVHQQENKDLSFIKFLDMHYMHGSPNDKDNKDDMKLPFKTAGHTITVLSPYFIPKAFEFPSACYVPIVRSNLYMVMESTLFSSYAPKIWQPPQSC